MQMRSVFAAAVLSTVVFMSGPAVAGPGAAGHGHGGETAFGKPGNPKKPARPVSITMREMDGKMAFVPALIEVKRGRADPLQAPQQRSA